MSAHREILEFLMYGKEEGFEIVKNIFFKQLSHEIFQSLRKNEDKDDLFFSFMEKLFSKRENIIQLFSQQDKGLPSYIRQMARNFLLDLLKKKSVLEEKIVLNNEDDEEDYLETKFGQEINFLLSLEIEEIKKIFNAKLKDDEVKLLCLYLNKDKQEEYMRLFFDGLSKDALYKRVERLKKKLGEIIRDNGFSLSGVECYFSDVLQEECKQLREG